MAHCLDLACQGDKLFVNNLYLLHLNIYVVHRTVELLGLAREIAPQVLCTGSRV
jgi:hypothetical protein